MAKLLAWRRTRSPRNRVASVSRSTGKFDTTPKPRRWQATFRGIDLAPSPRNATLAVWAQTQKAPLREEWRFAVLRWSLASQVLRAVVGSTVAIAGIPAGYSLHEGRSLALLLPDACVTGLAGLDSSSRYITGANNIAIIGPFITPYVFNELQRCSRRKTLHSGSPAPDSY